MSGVSIAPYFPFHRIKIVSQNVFSRCQRSSYCSKIRQTLSARLLFLRSKGFSGAQLESAQRAGSEPGFCQSVDQLSVPQAVLPTLSAYQYRRFTAV